ncbi:hypothetical protein D3C86_1425140 [compost metagenome]
MLIAVYYRHRPPIYMQFQEFGFIFLKIQLQGLIVFSEIKGNGFQSCYFFIPFFWNIQLQCIINMA